MVALTTLIDAALFPFFLILAFAGPLLDSQICLPAEYYPDILVDLNNWFTREYDDYLVAEKPAFFVGLIWVEILFQWPMAVASLYAIVASKSWIRTTCLMSGVCTLTSMSAIMSEMMSSGKASDKLVKLYVPFVGFGVLAVLRGLLPCSNTNTPSKATQQRKKRA